MFCSSRKGVTKKLMRGFINSLVWLDMNPVYLLIGILGIVVGLFAYYASVHDKVNALGRYTKPATALVIFLGLILTIVALI
jgi:hypothetical protein